MSEHAPLVILISGSGSNLQAIIDAVTIGGIEGEIRAVISNRGDAYGLERAKAAGISTEVIDHTGFSDRESFDRELRQRIESYDPGLVILAGFMRILSPEMTVPFHGRMFNIHPSLLPRFRGLHTHQRALDAGDKHHGCSVHFVTNELDGGPVIIQATVPVLPGDTADSLGPRVLEKEHIIYPLAVRWFCAGRLMLRGQQIVMDDRTVDSPIQLETVLSKEINAVTQ